MIVDGRRPPFCYQTHDALNVIRERFAGAKRTTALAVYVVLTEVANREGGAAARESGFRATRAEIAEKVGISLDTLDRYVVDLADVGLVSVEREKVGTVNLPNVWTLLEPHRVGAPPSRTGAATPSRTGAALSKEEPQEGPTADAVGLVARAWAGRCPPLIEHRPAYFESRRTQTAIRAALKVYPADVVEAAIENYSTVLASNDYIWSYRWTLIDFLRRGLDRFVPEADPLGNFRARGQTKPTSADFSQIDDL